MTTQQILDLDYRNKENQIIIQKVLRQIKPLSRFSDEYDLPIDAIEKAVRVMQLKYKFRIGSIHTDIWSNSKEVIYRAELINETDLSSIGYIYGISLYELFAKVCIKLYAFIRHNEIGLRKGDE